MGPGPMGGPRPTGSGMAGMPPSGPLGGPAMPPPMGPPGRVPGFLPSYVPPGQAPAPVAPVAAAGMRHCCRRGSDVPPTFRFCGTCGFRMDEGSAPRADADAAGPWLRAQMSASAGSR